MKKRINVIIHHDIREDSHYQFTTVAECEFDNGYPRLTEYTMGRMGYRGIEATERDLNKFFKTNRPIKNGYTYEFSRIYVEDGDTGRVTSSVDLIECKQTSELVLPVTKGNIEILLNAVPYIADKIPVNLSIEYIKALGGVFSEDGKTMTLTGYAKRALEVRASCP